MKNLRNILPNERVKPMWVMFNENPAGRSVGDCAIRALSVALGVDWETAYLLTAVNGFYMGDIQNSNSVWGSVLRQHGFKRYNLPADCPDCYTVKDFCAEHPHGIYVLGIGNHVVTAVDGDYYDAWNSGDEVVSYVWYRE